MKRYILLLSVFTLISISFLGSNAQSASAYDAGCTGAGPYSVLTGQLCNSGYGYGSQSSYYYNSTAATNSYVLGCNGYSAYNTVTGQPCYQTTQAGYQTQAQTGYAFTRELDLGSRGDDVLMLQQILQNKGYAVGGLDGIYGSRTRGAVTSYQIDTTLALTRIADSATLNSLNVASPTYYPPVSTLPPVPVFTPVISAVNGPQSLNVNQQGTWTISASSPTGGNLTYSVNWGDQPIYAYGTSNPSVYLSQQNAVFNHTYYQAGTYTPVFTVVNTLGQRAQSSLSVNVNGVANNQPIFISSISPNSSPTGIQVTIYGSGFARNNNCSGGYYCTQQYTLPNTIHFGYNATVSGSYSNDGSTLTFTVPYSNDPCSGCSYSLISPGTYNVYITNSSGTSNSVSFTVTSGYNNNSSTYISYLSPSSARVGTQVTIYGTGFSYGTNTINFGSNLIQNVYSYNGTSLTFLVPAYTSPACIYSSPACYISQTPITTGVYPVSVTNSYSISNQVNFTVTY